MELDAEFVRLPLRFDARRLADEVAAFSERDWRKHPQGHVGNSALPLVAVGGDPLNDDVRGPMLPTPHLGRCPYLRQTLAALHTIVGRTRLMRIEGNGEATMHTDINYYWVHRTRVHIPIVTYPEVEFICGETTVNMPAGECWIFDTWRRHNVLNRRPQPRIHLVCDTVGTVDFWNLVAQGDRPGSARFSLPVTSEPLRFHPAQADTLTYEAVNFPVVMTPGEQQQLVQWLFGQIDCPESETEIASLRHVLTDFLHRWRSLWAQFGATAAGFDSYRAALSAIDSQLQQWDGRFPLYNKSDLVDCLRNVLFRPALNPQLVATASPLNSSVESSAAAVTATAAAIPRVVPPVAPHGPRTESAAARTASRGDQPLFDRPIFIVSAPRSGSSLLFETLAKSPSLFTIGGESHAIIEGLPELRPEAHGWQSNQLTAADATAEVIEKLQAGFWAELRDSNGNRPAVGQKLRFLEKTPKNALRIPFLKAVFPDARFIYLVREPHEAISSILEAWRSNRFITYPNLPEWNGPWSLLLIPGWQQLQNRPLGEIAAAQWDTTNRIILDDLQKLGCDRWCPVTYSDLVQAPQETIERLCEFAGIEWVEDLRYQPLPVARHSLTPPSPDKWQRNAAEIVPLMQSLRGTAERILEVISSASGATSPEPDTNTNTGTGTGTGTKAEINASAAVPATPAAPPRTVSLPAGTGDKQTVEHPLTSQSTTSFVQLLSQLNASLLITTYQAGQLVVARVDEHGRLNTHFRSYPSPMGLAADQGRLAIGTKQHVWQLRNQPELGRSLDSRVDACYATRSMHVTGDIRIHEIGWCGEDLWIVNTRFSCLCTLDPRYSFVPRWQPKFITALTPDDRCHLNGMAIVDDRPRYCTALGETDTAGGWRVNKPSGGILIDVESGEIVCRGLSMPHAPRVYRDRLWILNSGHGTLETVDLQSGKTEVVARLPGFTRGLDFCGDFAFIGLSQIRETATFSGLPIVDELTERECGVWVVDLRTGRIAGFLRFSQQVQEIFAVQILAGIRFPEIIADDERSGAGFVLPPGWL